jgi:hypothetical protein
MHELMARHIFIPFILCVLCPNATAQEVHFKRFINDSELAPYTASLSPPRIKTGKDIFGSPPLVKG